MTDKVGVLLINLGTPDAPTAKAVKAFLAEFLHDKRVVDLTRFIWCPVLHGIVLPFRSPKVAKLYQSIWMEEGSPLMVYSKRQRDKLAQSTGLPVALGMTYGNPSIDSGLAELETQGCNKVLVLPLYPQYSATTTAAGFDKLAKVLKTRSALPELRTVNRYYQHPGYAKALAESVQRFWAKEGESEYLLCSYHGIPQRYADNGDPYPQDCQASTALLNQHLQLPEARFGMSYQSIFGREEWIKPYTEATIIALAEKGVKTLDVITPAFASDCLETLEEIAEQCQEAFIEAGGERLRLVPCLNDDEAHIQLLSDVIAEATQNW
ncbi:ferrochelatase [Thaumasiovibrio subtropicus]|uniref:ferrochelatase n=1 Tax=Thaumasiovibrio subtropicus TaxID=1891207 RepID=UPI000B3604F2|nr:ferrochelatase [Thaumasiovibrio subtropicus]